MGKSHTNKNIYRPCNKRPNATGITNKLITKFIKQSKHTIINGTTGLFWKNLDKHLYVHASKLPTKQILTTKICINTKKSGPISTENIQIFLLQKGFTEEFGEVKTAGIYLRKSALDDSSVYISHTKCCC